MYGNPRRKIGASFYAFLGFESGRRRELCQNTWGNCGVYFPIVFCCNFGICSPLSNWIKNKSESIFFFASLLNHYSLFFFVYQEFIVIFESNKVQSYLLFIHFFLLFLGILVKKYILTCWEEDTLWAALDWVIRQLLLALDYLSQFQLVGPPNSMWLRPGSWKRLVLCTFAEKLYANSVDLLYEKSRSVLFGRKFRHITISLQKIEQVFCFHMLVSMGSQIPIEVGKMAFKNRTSIWAWYSKKIP